MAISVLFLFLTVVGWSWIMAFSQVLQCPILFLNHLTGEKIAGFFDYVLEVLWLLVFCVSTSWCRNWLVCTAVYSVLSCF